jgi:hypothetical protein
MKEALNGWLAGKVKPTFRSLLKVGDFGASGGNERRHCAYWLRADTGQQSEWKEREEGKGEVNGER